MRADAAWRLGPRPVALFAWHRLRLGLGLAHRALPDLPAPRGPFLPDTEALASPKRDWHGPFSPEAHALDVLARPGGDIRTLWETHRLAPLLSLIQAATRDPAADHLNQAEALLADWANGNPPFRGPGWACAQEAALRAMGISLALALLGADRRLSPGARDLLGLHARRIRATRAYGAAQDNNHPISEAAGLFVCGLLLGRVRDQRAGARGLSFSVARLVSPCGAFAQASPAYHRLMLDVLAIAEWFRRRHGAPSFAAPFAARAAAATRWLGRVMAPNGALPRIGPCDDSAFADLSGLGAGDARASLERASRLFLGASAGLPDDPGCRALGLAATQSLPSKSPGHWRSAGWFGLAGAGGARGVLRTGVPLRFRPGQADLLHFDLWDGNENLLRDGGSGAYLPPPGFDWWQRMLAGGAGHNLITFDDAEPMPRLGPFLFGRWPRCRAIPDGAKTRDWRGNRHARRIECRGRLWRVEDQIGGGFRRLALRWRLCPGDWQRIADGVESTKARITLSADAPFSLELTRGWESPAYGRVEPVPVLEFRANRPIRRIFTEIALPKMGPG
ncbi:MAG: heparinase II/III-family protein [Roseomonas sp.]|nr:heparinase II/III-family protein [Roseomonas sp.]MCA3393327.1 heparinase II/III-family protein [Roseomonas sp.]MCA3407549.1 heparinase II/III-family protein [Roseomonas sp.]